MTEIQSESITGRHYGVDTSAIASGSLLVSYIYEATSLPDAHRDAHLAYSRDVLKTVR